MVKGIEKFQEHFQGFPNSFVLIGGVACDHWLESMELHFRATKDFDIVLIVENISKEFVDCFWTFIHAGKYEIREKMEGTRVLCRFTKPQGNDFPYMLELFSRQPEGIDLAEGQKITPIREEDITSSLSAILMDDDYYNYILTSRHIEKGLPIVGLEALIPLKARAWIDLDERRRKGETVDDDDVKKHRNDVFRLTATLTEGPKNQLPPPLKKDLRQFMDAFPEASEDWVAVRGSLKNTFGLAVPSAKELLEALNSFYHLERFPD